MDNADEAFRKQIAVLRGIMSEQDMEFALAMWERSYDIPLSSPGDVAIVLVHDTASIGYLIEAPDIERFTKLYHDDLQCDTDSIIDILHEAVPSTMAKRDQANQIITATFAFELHKRRPRSNNRQTTHGEATIIFMQVFTDQTDEKKRKAMVFSTRWEEINPTIN